MPPVRPGARRAHAVRLAALATVGAALLLVGRSPRRLVAHEADPTFADDVAPILYRNCTSCHRPGGLGPFSLIEYDSAVANKADIRDAVAAQQMPPWQADGPHGVFRNDRRLSDGDRETIVRWIDAGAKAGDLANLPPRPTYPTEWAIGTPDAIVSMPEAFLVPAEGTIEYMYFEVPTNFTEDKWVQAVEVMPGAREVVHHVLVYANAPANPPSPASANVPTGASGPRSTGPAAIPVLIRNRAQSRLVDPPRQDTLHAPPRQMGTLIGTTAPGTNVVEFAPGTALRLKAGTILTFQMHYTAHGHAMKDRTRVGFRFASGPPAEEIFATAFYNGSLMLPAGASNVEVPADITAGQPLRIWGLFPHTHLRGTRWKYTLQKPDGSSEVILDVPRYDFNWQTYYLFATPLDIPAGSKIVSTAWYDNSAGNKHNPDPTKDVRWGDQTWEEMQYTGFLYSIPGRAVTR